MTDQEKIKELEARNAALKTALCRVALQLRTLVLDTESWIDLKFPLDL